MDDKGRYLDNILIERLWRILKSECLGDRIARTRRCPQLDGILQSAPSAPALDYQPPADYARTLTTAIARPTARDDTSARRAIAHPTPIGLNTHRAPVAAG